VTDTVQSEDILDEDELAELAEAAGISGDVDVTKLQALVPGFRAPVAMLLSLEERAAEAKLKVPSYIKKIVADHIGYSLPAAASRGTMTEEEKKARQKEYQDKAKAERARVKQLLEASKAQRTDGTTSGK